jgi:hypothetical protein
MVGDGFLADGLVVCGHRLRERRIPWSGLRGPGEARVVGALSDRALVVSGGEAPGTRVVPGDDAGGDGDAGPVEVTVVLNLAARAGDGRRQPVERGGRLALGAQQRLRRRAQLSGRAAQDGRVLADADQLAVRDGDRQCDELVERDVERGTVRLRRGEPLP